MSPSNPPLASTAVAAARPRPQLWPAFYLLGYFVAVGAIAWLIEGHPAQLVFFALIGVATCSGFLVHALARPGRRKLGRKLSLALVGLSLFLGAGVLGRQSFQIEGFFFYVLAGSFGGVVVHYLVAKIAGPVLIGRAWCGWGCWIWMALDYLPWKRSPGRRAGWGWIRTAHFLVSLALVAALTFVLGYDHGFEWKRTDGLWWFLGGCLAYWAAGIALAAALKDNRAFCKYLCPVSVFLRAGNRLSLLTVEGGRSSCSQCGSCDRACPVDVKVSAFVNAGASVRDAECTLCQACVAVCPRGNLGLAFRIGGTTDPRSSKELRSTPETRRLPERRLRSCG